MLRIRFGFVKLNTSKKKITYMLIRDGVRITRFVFPSHSLCRHPDFTKS